MEGVEQLKSILNKNKDVSLILMNVCNYTLKLNYVE